VLAKRMKDIIDNYIMKNSNIVELYKTKREFLLLNAEYDTPDEHSIKKWQHFLPPVVDYDVI
jgi:hypothetical protein